MNTIFKLNFSIKFNQNYFYLFIIFSSSFLCSDIVLSKEDQVRRKENILDFSAGVIEGELNRPSILMELGTNFNDFNDLILLREDFNSFHAVDSIIRLRYMEDLK